MSIPDQTPEIPMKQKKLASAPVEDIPVMETITEPALRL